VTGFKKQSMGGLQAGSIEPGCNGFGAKPTQGDTRRRPRQPVPRDEAGVERWAAAFERAPRSRSLHRGHSRRDRLREERRIERIATVSTRSKARAAIRRRRPAEITMNDEIVLLAVNEHVTAARSAARRDERDPASPGDQRLHARVFRGHGDHGGSAFGEEQSEGFVGGHAD